VFASHFTPSRRAIWKVFGELDEEQTVAKRADRYRSEQRQSMD
jgi:hypothetical protein